MRWWKGFFMSEDSARKDQHFWNGVALLAFAALFGLCGAIVAEFGVTDLVSVGAFDLLVMGLATFRLLHLLTFDKIFDGVRATVMDQEGARLKVADRGWRRLASEFMQCIWCTGMWSGVLVVTIYLLGSWGRFVAIVLAVAGLGSLLQVFSKAVAAMRND
jgi:hypothetical protein